jgi:uncharacterized repeat protein (TIGR04052 family)
MDAIVHAMTVPRSLVPVASVLALVLGSVACTDDGGADDHGHDETGDGDGDGDGDPSGDGDGDPSGDGDGDGDSIEVTLQFAAAVGDQDAACGQTYPGIGSQATEVEIQDFRFYVHGIELIDAQGNGTALTLAQDGLWQHQDLALLDFEDGTGACQDGGTAERNDTVVGTVPAGDYTGIRFVLGVPFALNHHAVDSAPSPLNVPSMFWTWQGGYKFARIDLLNDNPDNPSWFWHQGSTGCESSGPTEPPTQECLRPNRLPIEFAEFDVTSDTLVLDIATLLDGVDVSQNTPMTAPGCMSAPTDPECVALFPNLGLSLDTGECVSDCADQQVFRVE